MGQFSLRIYHPPEVGETFTILKIDDFYMLKPKKQDIFNVTEDWEGFRESVTTEYVKWDRMIVEGQEN